MIKLKKISIVALLWVFISQTGIAQVPFTCEGQLFLSLEPNNMQQLVRITIDPFTNAAVFSIIDDNIGVQVNAIGYRRTDNLIYGVDPRDFHLYQIDATGTAIRLATLALNPNFLYFAGDVSQDGNFLYLIGSDREDRGLRNSELVRIDLRDPSYAFVTITMDAPLPIFDIAFDPISGELYGYVSGLQTSFLVTINPSTGDIIRQFPPDPTRSAAGLFFDAFGNLYAYGGDEGNNTMFLVNKSTGRFTFYVAGTDVQNADAASCPYTVEILKTASPEITVPCDEVVYTFKIANGSGRTITGIDFEDAMPPGFEVLEIMNNPYAGTVDMGGLPDRLNIENMTIPIGVDSILVRVEVGQIPPGIYSNQAELSNLPIDLGDFRLSDNPNTPQEDDSTHVEVLGTVWDSMSFDLSLCDRDEMILDASEYGLTHLWSTGSTDSQISITSGGRYSVTSLFGCDTNYVEFNVVESEISVTLLGDDFFEIKLGETIDFFPQIFNTGSTTIPLWRDPLGNSLSCLDCVETTAYPFFDAQYTFTAENEFGCMDSIQITVRVDKTRDIYAPDVFTPNDDGLNDLFFLQSTNFAIVRSFNVFNRWGDHVYDGSRSNIESSIGWDGTFKGEDVDPAVFVWTAEIEFLDGLIEVFSGDITVLK